MLPVYGDESADETKSRVFAVACVAGGEEMWEALEKKWRLRIGDIPFHANDCDSNQGDYKSTSHEDNKALYRDLTTILAESGLGGWAVAMDLAAQRQFFPWAKPELAYYKGFADVVVAVRNWASNNDDMAKLTFDMRRESEVNTGFLYAMFLELPDTAEFLFSEVSFACHRKNVRLQTSDLFAREAMKSLDNEIGPKRRPPRKSWMALRDTGRFHVTPVREEFYRTISAKMPILDAQAGFADYQYERWLVDNRLQSNVTNKLRYLRWFIWNNAITNSSIR